MVSASILDTIGNTPVVQLQRMAALPKPSEGAKVFVKLEFYNPTGSYKDRMALAMVEGALERGDLKPGMTMIEATGGSTGTSLAMICAQKDVQFCAHTSDVFAQEKLRSIRAYGGELEVTRVPKGEPIPPTLFPGMIATCKRLHAEQGDKYFYADQFNNDDVIKGFATLGHELVEQFPNGIDVFVAAVGTAGMIMGTSKVLKKKWPSIQIIVVEPASSPILSKGVEAAGTHTIDGIGTAFVPPHLDRDLIDEIIPLDEKVARATARELAAKEGILAGTSSGLNAAAALQIAATLKADQVVVTVVCDSGVKYMSMSLFE